MQVLAVVFDLLASHHAMARWHEEAILRHRQQLTRLQVRPKYSCFGTLPAAASLHTCKSITQLHQRCSDGCDLLTSA